MQPGDEPRGDTREKPQNTPAAASASQSIWRVPPPVQRLFDRFPLRVYPQNELPLRAPKRRAENTLYIFTTAADAALGAPSFNPGCLKWQAFLLFQDIHFRTVPSCNHASPSGALPFLLPGTPSSSSSHLPPPSPDPIPTSKLESWTHSHNSEKQPCSPSSTAEEDIDPTLSTYPTLLSYTIRLAYLHALYLHPSTFTSTASPLYIASSSSSGLVRLALERPLRAAALSELISTSNGPEPRVDVARLLHEADGAFGALSTRLGGAAWFGTGSGSGAASPSSSSAAARRSGIRGTANPSARGSQLQDDLDEESQQRDSGFGLFEDDDASSPGSREQRRQPGLLDAALFAYTHVILLLFAAQDADSPAKALYGFVSTRRNLVEHRERVLRHYFPVYYESGRWQLSEDEKAF